MVSMTDFDKSVISCRFFSEDLKKTENQFSIFTSMRMKNIFFLQKILTNSQN